MDDVFAPGKGDPLHPDGRLAAVARHPEDGHLVLPGREFRQDLAHHVDGPVRRAVVDEEELDVFQGLPEQRAGASGHVGLDLADRYDDTDRGHGRKIATVQRYEYLSAFSYLCLMQSPLVSILTPMYNTEKYVHRLLDSVLAQDYPAIEMVVVDDGSTDGSRAVVESYVGRFAAKGYTLRCFHQPNSGQSVAIKNGLQRVTGAYLAWPDSDDFYTAPDAISKMVRVLESAAPEFQLVRTQVRYVQDPSLALLRIEGLDAREEEDPSLFEDCLFDLGGFYYCAGSYLVRTAVLKDLTGFRRRTGCFAQPRAVQRVCAGCRQEGSLSPDAAGDPGED